MKATVQTTLGYKSEEMDYEKAVQYAAQLEQLGNDGVIVVPVEDQK